MSNTTQRLDHSTLEQIRHFGKMGDTFDDVLCKVLEKYKELEDKITELEEDEVSRLG